MLHLLSTLPARMPTPSQYSSATTSSSWDDMPSDLEDTFFLSGDEEIENYEREKKKRWMEALREDRLREREKEEETREVQAEKGKGKAKAWGGDDEIVRLISPLLRVENRQLISILAGTSDPDSYVAHSSLIYRIAKPSTAGNTDSNPSCG